MTLPDGAEVTGNGAVRISAQSVMQSESFKKQMEAVAWIRTMGQSKFIFSEKPSPMFGAKVEPLYTEDQMRACRAAALEEAAKVCENLRFTEQGPDVQAKYQRDLCAAAIRALQTAPAPTPSEPA